MSVKKFNTRIQLKNDTTANWSTGGSLQLLKGEFAWDSTMLNFKIGTGEGTYTALPYILPAFGDTLTSSTSGGLTTYNVNIDGTSLVKDSNGVISAVAAATPGTLTIGTMAFNGSTSKSVTVGTNLEFDPLTGAGDTVAIKHSTSSVTADTYGSTTKIPSITVDAQGHVTAASENDITVGEGTLTLTGDNWLTVGTGTGFNANATSNSTYTIAHKDATNTASTSTGTVGASSVPSGATAASNTGKTASFETVTYTFDQKGHVTGHNTKTNTIVFPSAADLGLSGAMHFLGTSSTEITDGGTENPTIGGSPVSTKTAGDVVLYDSQEFVWNGSAWELLGDEGSYALKTVSISAGNLLTGGGTLEENRTISHATVTAPTTPTATSKTQGQTVTAMTGITEDGYGHVTAYTTDSFTIPIVNDGALTISGAANGPITVAAAGSGYTANSSNGETYTITHAAKPTVLVPDAVKVAVDAYGHAQTGDPLGAIDIAYSNITSGLIATTTQEAIDEVAEFRFHTHNIEDLMQAPVHGENTIIFDCGSASTCINA